MCNRSFASDRIQQHEAACRKANKQRRVFDSTKQRLQGTEAAGYFRKSKASKGGDIKPGVSLFHCEKYPYEGTKSCENLGPEVELASET